MCIRGLDLFLRSFLASLFDELTTNNGTVLIASKESLEKLDKILTDSKFWKFGKDNSLKVTFR